jgi:UDP-N-acetylmuramoylalanine--D-glutamate ligase
VSESIEGADFRGKRVTVAGLGLFGGGAAVARWLVSQGARVTVTDLRTENELAMALRTLEGIKVEFVLGQHRMSDFEDTDLIIANPAVPQNSSYLVAARAAGVAVTSEIAIFMARTPARLALVTGTQGKSSTCQFLATLCSGTGSSVHLGGNIGTPLIEQLSSMRPDDIVVLELSSYQLEALPPVPRASAQVVAITNIGADHLERHNNIAAYAQAKARILELLAPGGRALLPAGHPQLHAACPAHSTALPHQAGAGPGLSIEDGHFLCNGEILGRVAELSVPGSFQQANALVALGVAQALGLPVEHLAGRVAALNAPPHRLQNLGEYAGRQVVDNGVSTTPESTCAALESVPHGATLLVGGQVKRGLDYWALARMAAERDTRTILFGAATPVLAPLFDEAGANTRTAADLAEATEAAFEWAPSGTTILFSPACSSFDAWPNFRARALAFRDALPVDDSSQGATT